MGPTDISTSENTTIKVTQLLKLAADGENWLTYHERVLNAATAHGLHRHLIGTVLKPTPIVEKAGKFYLATDDKVALSAEDLDKHETSTDSWEQKEAQHCRQHFFPTNQGREDCCCLVDETYLNPWQQRCSV